MENKDTLRTVSIAEVEKEDAVKPWKSAQDALDMFASVKPEDMTFDILPSFPLSFDFDDIRNRTLDHFFCSVTYFEAKIMVWSSKGRIDFSNKGVFSIPTDFEGCPFPVLDDEGYASAPLVEAVFRVNVANLDTGVHLRIRTNALKQTVTFYLHNRCPV